MRGAINKKCRLPPVDGGTGLDPAEGPRKDPCVDLFMSEEQWKYSSPGETSKVSIIFKPPDCCHVRDQATDSLADIAWADPTETTELPTYLLCEVHKNCLATKVVLSAANERLQIFLKWLLPPRIRL